MGFYNKVILLGNTTKGVEVRQTPVGLKVAKTSLACNKKYKGHDGAIKEEAMFIDITAFGKLAEIMEQYVTQGTPLLIDGRLTFNQWEKDGVKRSKHEVVVESLQMLGKKPETEGTDTTGQLLTDADIPF